MNTEQIEELANRDRIAASDIDIQMMLRTLIMPAFYADVGDVRWRRKNATIPLVAGTKQYDLEDDFFKMTAVYLPAIRGTFNADNDGIRYIGEDPNLVTRAEFNTAQSRPCGFYIVTRGLTEDNTLRAIKFDAPPDAAYTVYYSYLNAAFFADFSASVDMDQYVPAMLQPAIVSALRAQILLDRYNQKDGRYTAEKATYDDWIARIAESADLARRNYRVFMR